MKKNYIKPDADFISLAVAEDLTNGAIGPGAELSTEEMPDDW